MSATVVDLLTFPLHGHRLIEASAGTGKTYSIAALYLRLILAGGDTIGRRLMPPEILVVTFTDAATRELRDRIRHRLATAARALQQPAGSAIEDPFMQQLAAPLNDSERQVAARRLQLAAEWMDEAAISTIHSFCHRMLREHAFDSGALFDMTLVTDQAATIRQAVRDYWRQQIYPLDDATLSDWLPLFPSPDHLEKAIKPLLNKIDALPPADDRDLGPLIQAINSERQQRLAQLKAPWQAWCDTLIPQIQQAIDQRQVGSRRIRIAWFEKLAAWAADPSLLKPDLTATAWKNLTPNEIKALWKKGESPHDHPAFAALESLEEALNALPQLHAHLLNHAARRLTSAISQQRQQQGEMSFDDLLLRLDAALHGDSGERLAQRIASQFPVALIDEFQDTDPIQYRIFRRIYPPHQGNLILIGDPKQAIYSFRGADIYTYLTARNDCQAHYTLDRNFRSTDEMVAAVNQIFSHRQSAGGFTIGQGVPPLPFYPVQAKGRSEQLIVERATLPALTLAFSERKLRAKLAASHITTLLQQSQRGTTGIGTPSAWRPLEPADIAILVNSSSEAREIREALLIHGIRSVYLSDRNSVYASDEAQELLPWLRACADPDNDRLLRSALATHLIGFPWQEIERLLHNEGAWDHQVAQLRELQAIWQQQGVLPLIHHTLQRLAIARRLLNNDNHRGERSLTNLLHLAELLQRASFTLDGEHSLIRYLEEAIDQANEIEAGEATLRLESDADLVKLITVHKSKGLEFPIVIYPYGDNEIKLNTKGSLSYHNDHGQPCIALHANKSEHERALTERLGEEQRKLYVALTRARYATWIGIGKSVSVSALGHQLNIDREMDEEDLISTLATLVASSNGALGLDTQSQIHTQRYQPDQQGNQPRSAAEAVPRTTPLWRISSYSALSSRAESYIDTAHQARLYELAANDTSTPDESPDRAIHAFPRGTHGGILLHGLLEWCGREGFAAIASDGDRLQNEVRRRCIPTPWQPWQEIITDWLKRLIKQPLTPIAATLATLDHYQSEMEFWIEIDDLDTLALDRAVSQHILSDRPRPPLRADRHHGLFKGFIDLVICHNDRYYILDFKSNWLGSESGSYTAEAIESALLHHRYDLQAALYLLALHRLLRLRLADYDPDRHLGGALLHFIRGIDTDGGGLYHIPPPLAMIEAIDRLITSNERRA
jgi:exodeoxyribonuclease V beta subunit